MEGPYQKTAEFKKLKPWEWMWDRDVFAVQNPETGEVAYCTVMGRMGSFYGMAAYLGREGLENFFDIQLVKSPPMTLIVYTSRGSSWFHLKTGKILGIQITI